MRPDEARRPALRLRARAGLLLALAVSPGCAFFGSLVHGGAVAAGSAAGAALGGPAAAAVGGLVAFYGGDLAAEQLTGTRSVRVESDGKVPDPAGGGSLAGEIVSAATGMPSMNLDSISILLLAGIAYSILEIRKLRKEVDELWDRQAK